MLFACAAVALFASCSQEELGSDSQVVDNGLQQIKIGVGFQSVLSTRGTGTVGGVVQYGADGSQTDDPNGEGLVNVWDGQSFNLFMLEKGSLNLAMYQYKEMDAPEPIFNNYEFTAPKGVSDDVDPTAAGLASASEGRVAYYPATGSYDFWAYRLDDAVTGEPEWIELSDEGKGAIAVPFHIDGSQDVMVAKAQPTEALLNKLGDEYADRCFSAFTARKAGEDADCFPNLQFSHELTRLKFQIKGGNAAACDPISGIKIVKVEVLSKATGELYAAYNVEDLENPVVFDEEAESEFMTLKSRVGIGSNENLVYNDEERNEIETGLDFLPTLEYQNVGEALLVAPQDQYEVRITMRQVLQHNVDDEGFDESVIVPSYIKLADADAVFEKGKSYTVRVTLYGLEEIKINTTLTPWIEGGDVQDVVPEDDTFVF